MLETPIEIAAKLGQRIRMCRNAIGWTQAEAALRAGISYRTWRRLENDGKASIDDLIRAALALRCEQTLEQLFPPPAASDMDSLLLQQRQTARNRDGRLGRGKSG